jgi:hypothetical protein
MYNPGATFYRYAYVISSVLVICLFLDALVLFAQPGFAPPQLRAMVTRVMYSLFLHNSERRT